MDERAGLTWIVFLSVAAATLAPFMSGCQRGCEADYTCMPERPADDGCGDDPSESTGLLADNCGVWVSASMGDDDQPGTKAKPVRSLVTAIDRARAGSRRVYACGETFDERVQLPAGISLFGGFDCADGWEYVGAEKRATLAPDAGSAVFVLAEGPGKSIIGDLNIQAADAVLPGASSIAVLVLPNANAELRRSDIVAGNGADGADGDSGQHEDKPAPTGKPGKNGADACTMDAGLGGEQVSLDCGSVVTIGGQGGDSGESWANGGSDGHPTPTGANPDNFGGGGHGEDLVSGMPCSPGFGGTQGAVGDDGSGARGTGRLTVEGYLGVSGDDGKSGLPGQGGGGGGASIGSAVCGGLPHGGAGGGSGGTGGCGGKGGKGGQAGGSSFGIAAVDSGLALANVRITSGKGGNGGNGGVLQTGGKGGLPGLGGSGSGANGGILQGCPGGAGGNGGNGGNGGGGQGGHSGAVGLAGDAHFLTFAPVDFVHGTGGVGGLGGNPSLPESKGDDGDSGALVPLDP